MGSMGWVLLLAAEAFSLGLAAGLAWHNRRSGGFAQVALLASVAWLPIWSLTVFAILAKLDRLAIVESGWQASRTIAQSRGEEVAELRGEVARWRDFAVAADRKLKEAGR